MIKRLVCSEKNYWTPRVASAKHRHGEGGAFVAEDFVSTSPPADGAGTVGRGPIALGAVVTAESAWTGEMTIGER